MKIVAYEFYFLDPLKGYQFVGILPEKRKTLKRINKDSIRKWGKMILGRGRDSNDLLFRKVTLDMETGRILHANDYPDLRIKNPRRPVTILTSR